MLIGFGQRGKPEDRRIARMTLLAVALASQELGSAINLRRGAVCIKFPAHNSDSRGSDAFCYVPEKQESFWGTPLNQAQILHLRGLPIIQATKNAT